MDTTCFTFPSSQPGDAAWVADPSCRGSFDIISLCLSTTIICIWSSVHKDIPLKRLTTCRSLLRDAPLVLVALFAPEVLFYFAFNQYLCARELVRMASSSRHFEVPPSGKHIRTSRIRRLLNFLKLGKRPRQEQDDDTEFQRIAPPINDNRRQHAFTLTHGFYAVMGGFAIRVPDEDSTVGHETAKLTYRGVRHLMHFQPDAIPDLSSTSITDRSKSSSLGKAVLTIQVAWFCLNCVSRFAERLPLSLLEVSTLAHGLFTLSSYAMWWFKPLNIEEPTWISIDTSALQMLGIQLRGEERGSSHVTFDSAPRFSSLLYTQELSQIMDNVVMTGIPMVYASLHYYGWNAQFATMVEQKLWHIAVVVIMSTGAVTVMFERLLVHSSFATSRKFGLISKRLFDAFAFLIIPFFYTLGSMYLLVESVRQIWYLPTEGYVVASWTYYVPHWL